MMVGWARYTAGFCATAGLGLARSSFACAVCGAIQGACGPGAIAWGSLAWGGATCLQGTAAAPAGWGTGESMISAVDGMDGALGWAGRASSTGAETRMGVGSGLQSSGRDQRWVGAMVNLVSVVITRWRYSCKCGIIHQMAEHIGCEI